MSTAIHERESTTEAFREGIEYLADAVPGFEIFGKYPAIPPGQIAIADPADPAAVFQTMWASDALRYLTLQITARKSSGHPGGFASVAEAVAALFMLGQKSIVVEVGHHAPGYYSALFLDGSLEALGIRNVRQLGDRFRETHGLPGHVSGNVPGVLNPAGPLGQGQHFAMAAALLHRDKLFPVTIGDGSLGEPYVISSMAHFHTAFPHVTNFLPVLVWNGYSQEHHSMAAVQTNDQMRASWRSAGFDEVLLVDAKELDDRSQPGAFADSTAFSLERRLEFVRAVLMTANEAITSAMGGKLTALIIKQMKGAGLHTRGAKAHCLSPQDTLDSYPIAAALQRCALHADAWQLVRTNFERAGGGPSAKTAVTEFEYPLRGIGCLPLEEHPVGETVVPTTSVGRLAAYVGQRDPDFLVTNADGNQASGMGNINSALKIIHPIEDTLYDQNPRGQVYEPVNEDACAGLAAGLSLMGARALWCSYESFAVNALPLWQTVTQAMAELRRPTPSAIALLTAGALEQGRNGWTHQRPEIEAYLAAMIRNGNVFPLFPPDANSIQVCYEWALSTKNKGIVIIAGKSPLPIRTTFEQTRQALNRGAMVLEEMPGGRTVVFAVLGDVVLSPVFEAAQLLARLHVGVRIVSVLSPRRLYRPHDTAWSTCAAPDGHFLDDAGFDRLFRGDALIGVTAGAAGLFEPILLRSTAKRDLFTWKRGETAASSAQLMILNGMTPDALAGRALELIAELPSDEH